MYFYKTNNAFDLKIKYDYSDAKNSMLLLEWEKDREYFTSFKFERSQLNGLDNELLTKLKNTWLHSRREDVNSTAKYLNFNTEIKHFENRGKISIQNERYSIDEYIEFGRRLIIEYHKTKRINYLSCLCKLVDQFTSLKEIHNIEQLLKIHIIIECEKSCVYDLQSIKCLSHKRFNHELRSSFYDDEFRAANGEVCLLLADTIRSRVYFHQLLDAGIKIHEVILLKESRTTTVPIIESSIYNYCLETLAQKNSIRFQLINANTVNCSQVVTALKTVEADICVYSGFSGQIVSKDVLDNSPPLLHCHSGWLPEYPGSTTLFYSILNNQPCAVSAIYMDQNIDTGKIIAQREYSWPVLNMDIDHVYDNEIRSNLLCEILKKYQSSKHRPAGVMQPSSHDTMYYIIHPILKNISLEILT